MVAGVGLLGLVGLGAVGGIVANIALTPLTAGASLLQSYWYGAGLILGERMMYTVHWEKIKGRLDKGESFMNVLDQEMNKDITAIANLSFKAMEQTGDLFLEQAGITLGAMIEKLAQEALNPFFSGDRDVPPPGDDLPPPPPEKLTTTLDEILSWSWDKLRAERALAVRGDYEPFWANVIIAEYEKQLLDQTDAPPNVVPTEGPARMIEQPSETSLVNGFVFPSSQIYSNAPRSLSFPRQVLTTQRAGTSAHRTELEPYNSQLNTLLTLGLNLWNLAHGGHAGASALEINNYLARFEANMLLIKVLQQWIFDWTWLYFGEDIR